MTFRAKLLSLALALVATWFAAVPAYAKKVSLEWKTIKGAAKYEILIEDGEGKPAAKKVLDDTAWSGQLSAGLYFYKIRAIDRIKRPGIWSEPKALVVMPNPPELASPEDGATLTFWHENASRTLKWKPVAGAVGYQVEVKRGGKVVVNTMVKETQLPLQGLSPDEYRWSVKVVIAPDVTRAPASLRSKKWESEASDTFDFTVERKKLQAPVLVAPFGRQFPPTGGKMVFAWKEVEGATTYELKIMKTQNKGRALATVNEEPILMLTSNPKAVAILKDEGYYTWQVRALASGDPAAGKIPAGPESVAKFELDKNAMYVSGTGYVAFSIMYAPYTYKVVSPSTGFGGQTSSANSTLRLSGEWWTFSQIGLAWGGESTSFKINNLGLTRKNLELLVKYRTSFTNHRMGWFFAPKIGLEYRDYYELVPQGSGRSTGGSRVALQSIALSTLGLQIGIDIRKPLSEKFSLGLKAQYFKPLTLSGADAGSKLTGDASGRNLSFGLQGVYFFSPGWGTGLGGFMDSRSISYTRGAAATKSEEIYMDGVYFFGSLIKSF